MSGDGPLFLVRHGEAASSWGEHADPPLSLAGAEQSRGAARALLPSLRGLSPQLVSSPLVRARQTAQPLAEALAVDPVIDARFREIPAPVPLADRQPWLRRFMGERWSQQPDALHVSADQFPRLSAADPSGQQTC